MTQLRIENAAGSAPISSSSRLRVSVEYESASPLSDARFQVTIHDADYHPLFLLDTENAGSLPPVLPPKGTLTCVTDPIRLTPGTCGLMVAVDQHGTLSDGVEFAGVFEESFRDLYEDQVFAAKVCRTTPVYISGLCSYRYRQHPNSCCLVAQREGRLDSSREPFLLWLIAYLEQEGLTGGDAWRRARIELGLERRPPLARLASKRTLMIRRLRHASRWPRRADA